MALRDLIPARFGARAPLVSVIRLAGVIGRTGMLRGGGLNLEGLEKTIERAFAPRGLKAVALAVNSPGGSPVQSALIARRIRRLADEKNVPVIAFAEDVAASGGYWLACAADEIFAERSSILGSIGVISAGFGFAEALRRHGVERRVHTAGGRKGMLDPFREEDPEDVERLKAIQIEIHDDFKAQVRERRGARLKGDDEVIFSGDIFSGGRALELGLIDGLGDVRTVMRERFGDRVRLRPVGARPPLLRRRLGLEAPDGADFAARAIAAVEEWAEWKRFGL